MRVGLDHYIDLIEPKAFETQAEEPEAQGDNEKG
jgi:hypothetical protein